MNDFKGVKDGQNSRYKRKIAKIINKVVNKWFNETCSVDNEKEKDCLKAESEIIELIKKCNYPNSYIQFEELYTGKLSTLLKINAFKDGYMTHQKMVDYNIAKLGKNE